MQIEIEPRAAGETALRRWPCTISTENPATRKDKQGESFLEILDHRPGSVDLSRGLTLPVLEEHDQGRVNIGVIEGIHFDGPKLRGWLVLGTTQRAVELGPDIDAGIVTGLSVGYKILDAKKERRADGLRVVRAVLWQPFEVSITGVPVDIDAGINRSLSMADATIETRAEGETAPPEVAGKVTTTTEKTREVDCADLDPEEDPELWEEYGCEAERSEKVETFPAVAAATPAVEPATRSHRGGCGCAKCGQRSGAAKTAAQADLEKRALGVVIKRSAEIRRRVEAAGLTRSFADEMIDEGSTVTAATARIFKALEEKDMETHGKRISILPGADPRDHMRAGMTNALLHRSSPAVALTDNGRRFRNRTLLDMGRITLEAVGVSTDDLEKHEIAQASLGLNRRAGMHGISDFPDILADAAGKTLRNSYDEAPQTFGPICRKTTLPDFKLAKRNQLGEAPAFTQVLEGGEYEQGTIGEGRETYQLAKYGKKFMISWEALVNDDMDAFSRIPAAFGRQARNLESDLVWQQLTTNPTMGTDSVALFDSSTHKNYTSSGTVISVGSLGIARAALRSMLGLDGSSHINITPKYLIVPVALETVADQFVSQAMLANAAGSINPFASRLQVIAEPRLDANSAIAWYLTGDPSQIDMIETATLQGFGDGPKVETQLGWISDGLEIKARHVFAARVIDWRAFYKNAGA